MDARIKMMEGNVISVRVPIKIKRYGGKKLINLPTLPLIYILTE